MTPGKWISLFFLFLLAPVAAAENIESLRAEIEAETKCFASPGPEKAGPRAVCVWRPATACIDPLPTLYMADGMIGIYIAVLPLKRAMEDATIQPAMIIGLDPQADPEDRAAEYVEPFRGPKACQAHERWFLDFVISWAESKRDAAPHPDQRYVGGFSNGADWAVTVAASHKDLFAGVLVHLPMMAKPRRAACWTESGAEVRTCIGK